MRRLFPSLFLAVLSLGLGTGQAFADDDAPFGLRWGESVAEARAKGLEGPQSEDSASLTTIATQTLAGQPEATEMARLTFERRSGLQRVLWVSKTFDKDAAGEKGMALYRQMKQNLSETYGDPKTSDEEIAPDASDQAKTFWNCLALDGCAVFVTVWRTPDTDVKMRLVGTPKGEGWLEILFFGPDWSDILQERRKEKH